MVLRKIRDRRDEIAFGAVSDFGSRLTDRRFAKRSAFIFGGTNLVLWGIAVAAPDLVYRFLGTVADINEKGVAAILGVPFGAGMFFVYSLLRMRFTDVEDQSFGGGPMDSFQFNERSGRRWGVWVVSAAIGAINAALIAAAVFFRAGDI